MAEYIEREAALALVRPDAPEDEKAAVTIATAKKLVRSIVHRAPAVDVEKMSDGYHTFADLYEQRLILSAALAKNNPYAWKSKRHEDGSVPFGGGWFLLGFDTDAGCYTYHYALKDWDLFQCKELEKGKPWDGHTSKDVRRLLSIPAAGATSAAKTMWHRLTAPTAAREWAEVLTMRLIDADKFILALMDAALSSVDEDTILDLVDSIPTVDAVPVVRCKGCEYSDDEISYLCCTHGVCADCEVPPNFYCAEGKRKENDE